MKKKYTSFSIPKIWQILKHFTRSFHQAQPSYFWRVSHHIISKSLHHVRVICTYITKNVSRSHHSHWYNFSSKYTYYNSFYFRLLWMGWSQNSKRSHDDLNCHVAKSRSEINPTSSSSSPTSRNDASETTSDQVWEIINYFEVYRETYILWKNVLH